MQSVNIIYNHFKHQCKSTKCAKKNRLENNYTKNINKKTLNIKSYFKNDMLCFIFLFLFVGINLLFRKLKNYLL